MDAIDREILAQLQADGRLTMTDLAARVGLSLSPCHRRLRALEDGGLIRGYRAELDAAALGLEFEALVFVTIRIVDNATVGAFEEAVAQLPAVLDAQRLFGEVDYLLRVVAKDLAGYQQLYDDALTALPGVLRLSSTLVMKQIVTNRVLPL